MSYDHDHPELCPLPDCKSLGPDPEPPAERFHVLTRPAPAARRLRVVGSDDDPARAPRFERRVLAHHG